MSKRIQWESTPILNIIQQGRDPFKMRDRLQALTAWVLSRPSALEMGAVEYMKSIWGRQDYCFDTYRRYWVWEGKGWRAFVNRDAGISFEVRKDLSPDEAWAEFEKFRRGER